MSAPRLLVKLAGMMSQQYQCAAISLWLFHLHSTTISISLPDSYMHPCSHDRQSTPRAPASRFLGTGHDEVHKPIGIERPSRSRLGCPHVAALRTIKDAMPLQAGRRRPQSRTGVRSIPGSPETSAWHVSRKKWQMPRCGSLPELPRLAQPAAGSFVVPV